MMMMMMMINHTLHDWYATQFRTPGSLTYARQRQPARTGARAPPRQLERQLDPPAPILMKPSAQAGRRDPRSRSFHLPPETQTVCREFSYLHITLAK